MFRNDLTLAVANERFGTLLLIEPSLLVSGVNLTDIRGHLVRSNAMSRRRRAHFRCHALGPGA